MSSLITISALIFLSSLPVARADIQCDISISGTNICYWINHHYGVAFASAAAIVTLVVFLVVSVCSALSRSKVSPTVMRYAPSDQPRFQGRQISVPFPAEHLVSLESEPEPYTFAVPRQSWQSSEPSILSEKDWTDVDLAKNSARPRVQ